MQSDILLILLILLICNDLPKDLKCTVKLFADDTSIFTVVLDPNVAAIDLNHDLEHIKLWANRWRMSFNPDPSKQAVEITFSTKRDKFNHPILFFNNSQVMRVDEHKHLGLILDSKLSFSSHIHAAISKSRKAIGMLRLLSMYLPRETLNVLYKLYVRPHLDYGDVIYHIPHKESTLHSHGNALMQKIESVQYIDDPRGLALLTQLRLGLSNLNLHKFRHNFRDVSSPMCPVNDGPEDTEHYLLLCHSFDEQRRDLHASVLPVLHSFNKRGVPNQTLLQILLHGDKNLPFEVNKFILKSTISYILRTERLY